MRERDMNYERALRDAGRGHLLGDYPSPLERADIERKRQKEEPTPPQEHPYD